MFKISQHAPNGFEIKLHGMRQKFVARDFRELLAALHHYFGSATGSRHIPGSRRSCPLCREVKVNP